MQLYLVNGETDWLEMTVPTKNSAPGAVLLLVITARRFASAVYAVVVFLSFRPSVRPSVRHKSVFYQDG